MKVYLVFATDIHAWEETNYFEEVFLTKEKAECYIENIDEIDKGDYDYWIMEREVC